MNNRNGEFYAPDKMRAFPRGELGNAQMAEILMKRRQKEQAISSRKNEKIGAGSERKRYRNEKVGKNYEKSNRSLNHLNPNLSSNSNHRHANGTNALRGYGGERVIDQHGPERETPKRDRRNVRNADHSQLHNSSGETTINSLATATTKYFGYAVEYISSSITNSSHSDTYGNYNDIDGYHGNQRHEKSQRMREKDYSKRLAEKSEKSERSERKQIRPRHKERAEYTRVPKDGKYGIDYTSSKPNALMSPERNHSLSSSHRNNTSRDVPKRDHSLSSSHRTDPSRDVPKRNQGNDIPPSHRNNIIGPDSHPSLQRRDPREKVRRDQLKDISSDLPSSSSTRNPIETSQSTSTERQRVLNPDKSSPINPQSRSNCCSNSSKPSSKWVAPPPGWGSSANQLL